MPVHLNHCRPLLPAAHSHNHTWCLGILFEIIASAKALARALQDNDPHALVQISFVNRRRKQHRQVVVNRVQHRWPIQRHIGASLCLIDAKQNAVVIHRDSLFF